MLSSDRLASPLERSLSAIFRFLDVDSKACPLSLPPFSLSLSVFIFADIRSGIIGAVPEHD